MDSSEITYLTTKGEFGDSCSSTTFKKSSSSLEVPSTTLEQFFRDNSIDDCNFIKIDISNMLDTIQMFTLVFLCQSKTKKTEKLLC